MMRKEVKLGLAIGGVLLAVLVVYVLVVPGENSNQPGANLDGGTASVTPATPTDTSVTPTPAPAPTPAVAQTPANTDNNAQSPTDSVATGNQTDPFSSERATNPESTVADAAQNAADVDWATLLQGGQVPPLMSQTPVPSRTSSGAPASVVSGPANSSAGSNASTATPAAGAGRTGSEPAPIPVDGAYTSRPPVESLVSSHQPTTQPFSGSTRTHTVQPGESLTAISIAAYGSAKYTRQIAAANPTINPDRIKPGMQITLPDITTAKVAASGSNGSAGSTESTATLDTTKEYRVQSGDSLFKISVKLYGKGDRTNKLYEFNKQTIGPDAQKLKVGTVLKLPEAPTQTASR